MNQIKHTSDIIQNQWRTNGDIDSKVLRIANTGTADTDMQLFHELGRVPVCVRILLKNKACDMWVKSLDEQKIIVQFTVSNCDVNIEVY
jgi:hypothetical protein